MSVLNLPLSGETERRLLAIAKAEERTPVAEVLFILRRVLGIVNDPCPCVRYRAWGDNSNDTE